MPTNVEPLACAACGFVLTKSVTTCPLCAVPSRSPGARARGERGMWIFVAVISVGPLVLEAVGGLVMLIRGS